MIKKISIFKYLPIEGGTFMDYKELAYYNGEYGLPAEVKIPVEERGFLFGEGIYEAVIAYNHILWGLADHLDRLEESLRFIEMPLPMPRPALIAELERGLAMVEGDLLSVYIQVTRGSGPRWHCYTNFSGSVLTYVIRPMDPNQSYMETGLFAITEPDVRWANCQIKTTNLIPHVMAYTHAQQQGAYTAIFHREGRVTEGSAYNAFMVKRGVILTAPLSHEILPGVTRKHFLPLAAKLGIPLEERSFSLDEMYAADEVFLTATPTYPMPIVRVDGRQIGDGQVGSVSRRLHTAYEELIAAHCGPLRQA
jgi:D-alanine transaminase